MSLHDRQMRAVQTAQEWTQGNIQGLDDAMTRRLVASTVMTESNGGDLSITNAQGYVGRYQAGAGWLADAGLVDARKVHAAMVRDGFRSEWKWAQAGLMTRFLHDPANWNGGLSLEAYKASADLQDRAFLVNCNRAVQQEIQRGRFTADSDPRLVASFLKARHIAGLGGAEAALSGVKTRPDVNGTSNMTYFSHIAENRDGLDGLMHLQTPVASTEADTTRKNAGDDSHSGTRRPTDGGGSHRPGHDPMADGRLAYGESGTAVRHLQAELKAHGIRDPHGRPLPVTGHFRDKTRAAVGEFQRLHGLPVTGVADGATLHALAKSPVVQRGDHGPAVLHVQQMLGRAGIAVPANGTFTYLTEGAVKDFQAGHGLKPTGVVNGETHYQLQRASEHGVGQAAPTASDPATGEVHQCVERAVPTPAVEHPLVAQARSHIEALDRSIGRARDAYTDNLITSVAVTAQAAGLGRIDDVVLSAAGDRLVAVQGEGETRRVASVDIREAMVTPVQVNLAQLGEGAPILAVAQAATTPAMTPEGIRTLRMA